MSEAGHSPSSTPARFYLALLAAGVLWSLGGLFIKTLTAHPQWHSSAWGIVFYRSLFAALCLLPLLRGRTLPRLWEVGVGTVIYTLLLGLYVASTQGTTAANAIFLQYTAPVYALLLGPRFFGEPFRKEDGLAVGLAMAGIAVLVVGNWSPGSALPLLMGAGSGLMFGVFLLWLRRMRSADPIAVTVVNNLGVALLSGLALAFAAPAELTLLPRVLTGDVGVLGVTALMALMGAVQIAAPYVLFSYGLQRVPGVEASLLALVEPLLNPVWVILAVGEWPSAATVMGGALIVVALAGRYALPLWGIQRSRS